MTRDEFLAALTHRLGYLPYGEVKKTVDFYREAIADRMEDGMTEAEAVAALGSLDEIVREIEMNLPLSTVVKTRVDDARERAREKKETESGGTRAFKILFLLLTCPIWGSLLIAGVAVVLSLLITLFSVVFALAVTAVALIASGLAMAVIAFIVPYPSMAPRLMLSGIGLVITALGCVFVFAAMVMGKAVSGSVRFTKKTVKKAILRGKGAAS